MRDTILRGLAQAYENLVHMIADFLPRFAVMLTIILVGLLIAFLLKKVLRSILHLTKLDRISERAGASHVLRKAAMPSMSEFLSRSLFWITLLGFILLGISVLQIAELQEVLAQRETKLAEAQTAQAELIRKQRELNDAKRAMELTIETRVQESLSTVRDQAKKDAEDYIDHVKEVRAAADAALEAGEEGE